MSFDFSTIRLLGNSDRPFPSSALFVPSVGSSAVLPSLFFRGDSSAFASAFWRLSVRDCWARLLGLSNCSYLHNGFLVSASCFFRRWW